jgi:hypothetical protein
MSIFHYLMKVIPETNPAHKIRHLRFYYYFFFFACKKFQSHKFCEIIIEIDSEQCSTYYMVFAVNFLRFFCQVIDN